MSPTPRNEPTKYIIDTNFIFGFEQWIPIELNNGFWSKLSTALKEEKWVFLDVVSSEVKYPEALRKWRIQQVDLVTNITPADRTRGGEINDLYPMIDNAGGSFKSETDTYILAFAERNGFGVFSRESNMEPGDPLYKIPDVAEKLGIKCKREPIEFLKMIGYTE